MATLNSQGKPMVQQQAVQSGGAIFKERKKSWNTTLMKKKDLVIPGVQEMHEQMEN